MFNVACCFHGVLFGFSVERVSLQESCSTGEFFSNFFQIFIKMAEVDKVMIHTPECSLQSYKTIQSIFVYNCSLFMILAHATLTMGLSLGSKQGTIDWVAQKQQNFIFHSSVGYIFEIRVPAWLSSAEGSLIVC